MAVEAQFYVLSPLLLWAVYSPARRAPRRWGMPALVATSLAGVAVNLGLMLGKGTSAFTMPLDWPPTFSFTAVVTRSPPYIAGMFAAVVLHRAARLPTTSALPPGCLACSCSSSSSGDAHQGQGKGCPAANGAASSGDDVALAAGMGRVARLVHRLPPLRPDLPAFLLTCGLAYTGTGMNM